jgi:hypothetical protein
MIFSMRLMLRCLLVVLLSGSVAQSGAQSALSVHGSVVDPTGAGIPGATVRLETASGDLLTQSQSDAKGEFILLNLPSGNYSLVVPAYSGFGSHTLALRLYSSLTGIKVTLTAQSVNQEIDVAPDESLSTESSANRDTVSVTGDQMRKLPVFDQDYIATLTPFLDASAGSSGGVTLIVDGIEMKSVGVSASAIQEVRINNDPYSAEFTRPGRGRIEIITKPAFIGCVTGLAEDTESDSNLGLIA